MHEATKDQIYTHSRQRGHAAPSRAGAEAAIGRFVKPRDRPPPLGPGPCSVPRAAVEERQVEFDEEGGVEEEGEGRCNPKRVHNRHGLLYNTLPIYIHLPFLHGPVTKTRADEQEHVHIIGMLMGVETRMRLYNLSLFLSGCAVSHPYPYPISIPSIYTAIYQINHPLYHQISHPLCIPVVMHATPLYALIKTTHPSSHPSLTKKPRTEEGRESGSS